MDGREHPAGPGPTADAHDRQRRNWRGRRRVRRGGRTLDVSHRARGHDGCALWRGGRSCRTRAGDDLPAAETGPRPLNEVPCTNPGIETQGRWDRFPSSEEPMAIAPPHRPDGCLMRRSAFNEAAPGWGPGTGPVPVAPAVPASGERPVANRTRRLLQGAIAPTLLRLAAPNVVMRTMSVGGMDGGVSAGVALGDRASRPASTSPHSNRAGVARAAGC
jgi:hypothetical protein